MDSQRLNEEGRALWDRKAAFWDALQGERGNVFHRRLVEPALLNLLDPLPGESVLDVGCGNGALARSLAERGALVTAIDYSGEMLRLARKRGIPSASRGGIDYRQIDATDHAALLSLGESRFDAITCAMTLMDMPLIQPLFGAARHLLRGDGRFVFVTMHPAFNSNNPIFLHEKDDRDGVVSERYGVKIHHYLDMPPVLGSGAPGEPTPHYYFHRPLSRLLGAGFAAGFALDGLLEPAFSATDAALSQGLNWTNLPQIPPLLAGRLRPV